MNRFYAIALVLLLLPTALQQAPQSAATHVDPPPGGGAAWWGPDAPDAGHHIRVAVTVENPFDEAMDTLTARAQLDLSDLLSEAGWIHTAGERPLLKGFHLDQDSVRVVRVTSHDGGQPVLNDPDRVGDDRFVVPSLVLDRPIEPIDGLIGSGNPTTQPVLTVYWNVNDLQASGQLGDQQYFYVYLDTTTNGDHGPADLHGTDVGAVEALHWIGPGARAYGVIPPLDLTNADTPVVRVVSLYDDTDVEVFLQRGTSFTPHPDKPTFTMDKEEIATVGLGDGKERTAFRVDSDKPTLVFVGDAGYAPSVDGGFVGREFLVRTNDPGDGTPTSLNLLVPDPPTDRSVTVTATRVSDGSTSDFELSGAATQFRPYNTGVWAYGSTGSCQPADGHADTTALLPGTLYRVQASHDVLVQVAGPMSAQQIPSLEGGPSGTEFGFLMEETYHSNPSCQSSVDERAWWASAQGPTDVYVDSIERPERIDPQPSTNDPDPRHAVPAAPERTAPFLENDGLKDRPLFAHAGDPTMMFLGTDVPGRKVTSGAHAYPGGLGATGFGPAMLFAYHDETRMEVSIQRTNSGTTKFTQFISEDGSFAIEDQPGGDVVVGWSVQASKPVAAYGLSDSPGYLASMPTFARVTFGATEYKGYLLDVSSPTGAESQTQTTVPGQSVTYTFLVHNLARGADGTPLTDTAQVRVGDVPDGWTATLARGGTEASIALGASATETVDLIVTPPSGVSARTLATIQLIASSQNNPELEVSSSTVTNIRRSFDVGTWFDTVGGRKTQEAPTAQGTNATYIVLVKNEGTETDTVDLTISGLEPGWDARAYHDGEEVSQLLIDPGPDDVSVKVVKLVVTPPAALADGLLAVTLTATSGSQPSAFDRVTAITNVQAPADIKAVADFRTALVEPGADALFPIHVTNAGAGSIELDLEAAADVPPGWGTPGFFVVRPDTGERTAVSSLSIAPGEVVDFLVAVQSDSDALAGDLATVRALARARSGESVFELSFTAVTAAVHDLEAAPSASPLVANADGTPATFQVTLTNRGNLDERLSVDAAALPPGWSLSAPAAQTVVQRGATATVDLGLVGPVGAAVGGFDLRVRLQSVDGTVTEVPVPTVVPDATGLIVELGPVEPAQPGRAALMLINVTNAGNQPTTVSVQSASGEQWDVVAATATRLEPGATRQMLVGWSVPADARTGASGHALELVSQREDDGTTAKRVFSAQVEVDRPEVAIKSIRTQDAPGGTLAVATLSNPSNRTAHDVVVQLWAGEQVVDEVTLGVLGANTTAVVSLLDGSRTEGLRVVIDPEDRIVESDEADNELLLSADTKGSPGLGPLLSLGAILVCVWVMRRSRP